MVIELKNDIMKRPPLSVDFQDKLYNYLNKQMPLYSCDDYLTFTIDFLKKNSLPIQNVLNWTMKNDINCDCKMLRYLHLNSTSLKII